MKRRGRGGRRGRRRGRRRARWARAPAPGRARSGSPARAAAAARREAAARRQARTAGASGARGRAGARRAARGRSSARARPRRPREHEVGGCERQPVPRAVRRPASRGSGAGRLPAHPPPGAAATSSWSWATRSARRWACPATSCTCATRPTAPGTWSTRGSAGRGCPPTRSGRRRQPLTPEVIATIRRFTPRATRSRPARRPAPERARRHVRRGRLGAGPSGAARPPSAPARRRARMRRDIAGLGGSRRGSRPAAGRACPPCQAEATRSRRPCARLTRAGRGGRRACRRCPCATLSWPKYSRTRSGMRVVLAHSCAIPFCAATESGS